MNTEQLFPLANEAYARGDLQGAEQYCRQILQQVPESSKALYLLGIMAGRQGNMPRAAELLQKAAQVDPGDPLIHANLANALAGLNQLDAAEEEYLAALRLLPSFPEAHHNLGNLYRKRGFY